jgi:hypothetical protein
MDPAKFKKELEKYQVVRRADHQQKQRSNTGPRVSAKPLERLYSSVGT